MPDKMIRKLSRKLNEKKHLSSFSIVVCRFFVLAAFCVIPYAIVKLFDISGIKNLLNEVNAYLYPTLISLISLWVMFRAFCLLSSFSLGEKAWYSGRLTRRKLCGKRLLFWFKPSFSIKALKLNVLLFITKLLWTAALLSPSLLLFSAVIGIALTGGIELYLFITLTTGGAILLITGLSFRFFIVQRYFLAPYLLADDPKLKPIQAIKRSKNLLEGHIYRIVKFKLKYLPSFLLYPFVLPAIFFYPNYKQSCSLIAKEICL